MQRIKAAIVGYGNLGRGVELAVEKTSDMELVGVFTRRDPEKVNTKNGIKAYHMDDIMDFVGKIDVLILCGGSATDLPIQSPNLVKYFNIVDSFDTHAQIPNHYKNVNTSAVEGGNLGIISVGWDPGLFSMQRLIFGAVLPQGKDYTFWGPGISQGHSDAIRRIDGVLDAKQYTIPIDQAVDSARSGHNTELTARDKHLRSCYVVVKDGADKSKIESEIKNMPNYFSDYNTEVNFVSQEELNKNHSGMPHGGFVIRSGETSDCKHILEFSIKLDSNPEFTSGVLVAYARAAYTMNKNGDKGCKTVFDVPLSMITEKPYDEIIKGLL